MSIFDRIEIARANTKSTNCGGTALFIAGVIPEDTETDIVPSLGFETDPHPLPLRYFGDMPLLREPEHGALVLLELISKPS